MSAIHNAKINILVRAFPPVNRRAIISNFIQIIPYPAENGRAENAGHRHDSEGRHIGLPLRLRAERGAGERRCSATSLRGIRVWRIPTIIWWLSTII